MYQRPSSSKGFLSDTSKEKQDGYTPLFCKKKNVCYTICASHAVKYREQQIRLYHAGRPFECLTLSSSFSSQTTSSLGATGRRKPRAGSLASKQSSWNSFDTSKATLAQTGTADSSLSLCPPLLSFTTVKPSVGKKSRFHRDPRYRKCHCG